jgi:hypothetical protein
MGNRSGYLLVVEPINKGGAYDYSAKAKRRIIIIKITIDGGKLNV